MSIARALVVADYGSVSRTARVIGVQQSAISRQIQTLEDRLGVSLFERHGSGVRLTKAGRHFFERTRPAFKEIETAIKQAVTAGCGAEGAIGVGLSAPISEFLAALLKRFRAGHPAVFIDFQEGSTRRQIAGFMNRTLDLAFLAQAPDASDFDIEPLGRAHIIVAVPEGHVLSIGKEIDWAYLRNERFIFGRDEGDGELRTLVQKRFGEIEQHPQIERHAVAAEMILSLVALEWGIALVSETVANRPWPSVVFRPLAEQRDRPTCSVIWLPESDNPVLRRFLGLMRSKAAERASALPVWHHS